MKLLHVMWKGLLVVMAHKEISCTCIAHLTYTSHSAPWFYSPQPWRFASLSRAHQTCLSTWKAAKEEPETGLINDVNVVCLLPAGCVNTSCKLWANTGTQRLPLRHFQSRFFKHWQTCIVYIRVYLLTVSFLTLTTLAAVDHLNHFKPLAGHCAHENFSIVLLEVKNSKAYL